jgi:hypothetical protein
MAWRFRKYRPIRLLRFAPNRSRDVLWFGPEPACYSLGADGKLRRVPGGGAYDKVAVLRQDDK